MVPRVSSVECEMQKKVKRGLAFVVVLMSWFHEIRGGHRNPPQSFNTPNALALPPAPASPDGAKLADIKLLLLDPHTGPEQKSTFPRSWSSRKDDLNLTRGRGGFG